jgi:Dullard-like phosphatase family protein
MLILFNAMLVYHISFDQSYLNTCYDYLEIIVDMNHKTFLLLSEYISMKISSSAFGNNWVKRLFKLLKENLVHLNEKDSQFVSYLTSRGYNLSYNSFSFINEIKYYSSMINKYIIALLKNLSDDNMIESFFEIINNISNLTTEDLNDFFRKKVIRILNKNASVAGTDASLFGWGGEHVVKVPYLTNKSHKKFTLVLDLDETLICFIPNPEGTKGTLKFRPGLNEFLRDIKSKYEIITFTSATKDYADPIENAIEQNNKYFDARLYRHHTIIYENEFVKDITRIGRPLDKMIIVDNMPQNFRLQKENGIFIKPFWGDDIFDTALFSLADILEKINNEFDDVRQGIFYYKDEILNKVTSNFSKRGNI